MQFTNNEHVMRETSVSWQKNLAQGFSSARELLDYLNLPVTLGSQLAEKQFKTRVPRSFARKMQPGNEHDPLLKQVLAIDQEMIANDNYVVDPLEELINNPVPGLLHKYHGRVLLTLTGSCAINCRFCFRRHFPYQDNNPGRAGWQRAVDYIQNDPSIHEVILSGGDPLLASDDVLEEMIIRLESIPHVKTLRMHTRIPVVLPERVDSSLLKLLEQCRLRKVVVLHCNHAQEIDEPVRQACLALRQVGCHLLNQSVLLTGVNDCAHTLASLSEALFDCGVLPYYLHVMDKVAGTGHFDMHSNKAKTLYRELQALVPGYLLPKLAREEPGMRSKTLIATS
jgi:EF-P beta-lysylation protein EpmB